MGRVPITPINAIVIPAAVERTFTEQRIETLTIEPTYIGIQQKLTVRVLPFDGESVMRRDANGVEVQSDMVVIPDVDAAGDELPALQAWIDQAQAMFAPLKARDTATKDVARLTAELEKAEDKVAKQAEIDAAQAALDEAVAALTTEAIAATCVNTKPVIVPNPPIHTGP
jgi:hypothetical protein